MRGIQRQDLSTLATNISGESLYLSVKARSPRVKEYLGPRVTGHKLEEKGATYPFREVLCREADSAMVRHCDFHVADLRIPLKELSEDTSLHTIKGTEPVRRLSCRGRASRIDGERLHIISLYDPTVLRCNSP